MERNRKVAQLRRCLPSSIKTNVKDTHTKFLLLTSWKAGYIVRCMSSSGTSFGLSNFLLSIMRRTYAKKHSVCKKTLI
jgi:hypothetical protein